MDLKNPKSGGIIISILHLVGIVGTLVPFTSDFTVSLTPVNLLLSSLLLILYSSRSQQVYVFLFFAFCTGMIVEIVGVKTGFPFGTYSYGNILGSKLLGVPLMIGINWFMLSFAIGTLIRSVSQNLWVRSMLGASGMTFMDLMIEPVAIKLDYWQWGGNVIPLSNYLSWWLISFFILLVYNRILTKENGQISMYLIISQVIYFICVIIFY